MDLNDSLRAFVLGIVIVVLSVLSRIGDNLFMAPRIGEYAGHVITIVFLMCVVLFLTYMLVRGLKIKHRTGGFRKARKDLRFFGLLWLIISFLADFIQQYLPAENHFTPIWADYNILSGRLMGLFLLVVVAAPYGFGILMLRRRRHRSRHR